MEMILRHKFILIIAVVLVAGVMWFVLAPSQEVPLVVTENTATATDGDLVQQLLQLRAVSLSGTIFSDPSFMSLQDFGVELRPEPVGRPNPFAPLTVTPVQTPITTHEAQIFAPTTR